MEIQTSKTGKGEIIEPSDITLKQGNEFYNIYKQENE